MIAKVCVSISLLSLLGCAQTNLAGGKSPHIESAAMYQLGDGKQTIRCDSRVVPNICAGSGLLSSPLLFDCSDERFDCVFDTLNVMAVPKGGYALGESYQAFGASLKVERCFGDQATCEMAVISSRCEDASDCTCRLAEHKQKTIFYFSRERGIIAFYTTLENTSELADKGIGSDFFNDAVPMMTYFLIAEKGLLRAPWVLEKTSSREHPRRAECRG